MSEIIFKARWRMFGHVLRMKDEVPAKQTMIYYFLTGKTTKGFVGRPRTTLSVTIDKGLRAIHQAATKPGRKKNTIKILPSRLSCIDDLRTLEKAANGRKGWMKMIEDSHALLQSQREKAK